MGFFAPMPSATTRSGVIPWSTRYFATALACASVRVWDLAAGMPLSQCASTRTWRISGWLTRTSTTSSRTWSMPGLRVGGDFLFAGLNVMA